MSPRVVWTLALIVIGAAWGITQPFTKISVSVGYAPMGLIFWQLVISAVILTGITFMRGKGLPIGPRQMLVYAVIAAIGTILPNLASYRAAFHLPAGIMSIIISLVPMMAFPVAIAMGNDRFTLLRFAGLLLGFGAMLLIALPEASLPSRAMVAWLPLALIAPAFYAFEGNWVAKYGTAGLDPLQTVAGAAVLGCVVALPAALATGTFISPIRPWGPAEFAIVGNGLAHAAAYSGYVWLVGRAGATFAAQVAYLVTGFGVLWSMAILAESYSPWIWAALLLMFAGLFLVQPRGNDEALTTPAS